MSELKTNLELILQEKTEKIISQNIKKNIEVLGVTGSYDKEDVKELQDELDAAEAELAAVRRDLENSSAEVTGSGENVTLNGTTEARFKELPLPMGNSEQVQYSGGNLFNIETSTEDINCTKNNNIFVSNALNSYNVIRINLGANIELENGVDYYISYDIKTDSGDAKNFSYFGRLTDSNKYTSYGSLVGTFTMSNSYQRVIYKTTAEENIIATKLVMQVNSSITNAQSVSIKNIQISTSNLDYEPYVGGQASPNPDYPQEITNVTGDVEVKVQNKNWFTSELENGWIDTNGKNSTLTGVNSWRSKNYIKIKENTTYILSRGITGKTINYIYFYDENYNYISRVTTNTFTTPPLAMYMRWRLDDSDTIKPNFIQLEQGSTPTTYTPHQEQVLPLTLGNIELCKIGDYQNYFRKSTGKNLLNIVDSESGGIDSSGIDISGSNLWRDSGYIEVKPNTSYTLSRKVFSDNVPRVIRLYEYDNDKLFVSPRQESATDSLTIITGINTKYIRWSIFEQNSTLTELVVKDWNLQIEQNSSVTEYEPYGKVWYLHKEIEKRIFNGTENWTLNSNVSSENYKVFYLYNTGMLVKANVLCNNFTYINSRGTANCIWTPYSTELDISISYSVADTVEAFKTWLSTHNTIVYYPLATPTDTEITDTTLINQLEAIRKAISYDEQTNVSSNTIALFDIIALRNMNDTLNTLENEIELLP